MSDVTSEIDYPLEIDLEDDASVDLSDIFYRSDDVTKKRFVHAYTEQANNKAREASKELVSEYHETKKKRLGKWKPLLTNDNPDLLVLGDKLVVRLNYLNEEGSNFLKNVETALKIGDFFKASDGHFYGLIVEM